MTQNRQQRRAALRAMKRYVRSLRPSSSFLTLQDLQRLDPETGMSIALMIAEDGYQPNEVVIYQHVEGVSVMFPFGTLFCCSNYP